MPENILADVELGIELLAGLAHMHQRAKEQGTSIFEVLAKAAEGALGINIRPDPQVIADAVAANTALPMQAIGSATVSNGGSAAVII